MAYECIPIWDCMQAEPPFAILRTSRPFRFFSGGRTMERLPPWPNMNLSARDGAQDDARDGARDGARDHGRGHSLPRESARDGARDGARDHGLGHSLPRESAGYSMTMGYHKEQCV
jgi:hypothetical protein